MQEFYAVIGGNYGDEGKGLVTDYLSDDQTTVVRFNGGAQAGHTVVTPENQRHVFSSLGSGTFRGALTYLSKFFTVNPRAILQEIQFPVQKVEHVCVRGKLYIHPDANVSTPFDEDINQRSVSNLAHGTCGWGIWETAVRSVYPEYRITAAMLSDSAALTARILKIQKEWYPHRLASQNSFFREGVSQKQVEDYLLFCKLLVDVVKFSDYVPSNPRVVFEGAQGLGLDEVLGTYPHVTSGRTGLHNVVELLPKFAKLTAYYVTRSYLTRHGAGPLEGENPDLWYLDNTNTPNPFQGVLRYAPLNAITFNARILRDWQVAHNNDRGVTITPEVVVTHCDQAILRDKFVFPTQLMSFGPTRTDVRDPRSNNK